MTREEEIIEASQLYANHQQKPFMDGALWADKTRIEKAIMWLEDNVDGWIDMPYDQKAFIEEFRKAMKTVTEHWPSQITQKMLNDKLQDVSKPIPITEKLLKMNNFVRSENTASYDTFGGYGYGCPDEHYVTYTRKENTFSVKVRFMNGHLHDIDVCSIKYWMSTSKIKYVHELQTALTLCEADLKIKER